MNLESMQKRVCTDQGLAFTKESYAWSSTLINICVLEESGLRGIFVGWKKRVRGMTMLTWLNQKSWLGTLSAFKPFSLPTTICSHLASGILCCDGFLSRQLPRDYLSRLQCHICETRFCLFPRNGDLPAFPSWKVVFWYSPSVQLFAGASSGNFRFLHEWESVHLVPFCNNFESGIRWMCAGCTSIYSRLIT